MLIQRQQWLIFSLVGGMALMVTAIGLLGIYFTHKVAGPIFKMKRLLKEVGDGNLHIEARLRKGDELQDFFDAFTQMLGGLRSFERQQLAELELAMSALEQDAKGQAVSSIGKVQKALKRAIEKPGQPAR